jgi:hypothetical protein
VSGDLAAATHRHALVDALSAKIEMELGELEPDEAAVFMEELGIAESSLDRVIALSYRLLGPDLVPHRRARRGPCLAGPGRLDRGRRGRRDPHRPRPRLHPGRDVAYEDLLDARARWPRRSKARQAPLGGQDLPVRDGDVVEILFSR